MSDNYVKSENINEGLDGYSRDENNVIIIDPNTVPVKHEDLFIYATLKARARTKSLVTLDDSDNKYMTEISFLPGTETSVGETTRSSFLTTNWTDIGGKDFKTNVDQETFGMTSIDISLNAGFIPTVVIEFTDIRGATLFEQGSCSPYAAFFHQPYPIFELTVKGFYGSPVTYYLAIQKFNTSFDPQSGNYKSRAEFIGYSYAFLSDILLGYVLAAPYMENSCGKLENVYTKYLEYYQKRGFNTDSEKQFNPFNDEGEGLTLFEYVTRLKTLVNLEDDFAKNTIRSIQNLDSTQRLNEFPSLRKLITENINNHRELIIKEIKDFNQNGYQSKTDPSWNSNSINSNDDRSIVYFQNDGNLLAKIKTYVEFINTSLDLYNKNFEQEPEFRFDFTITIDDINNEKKINYGLYDTKVNEILSKLKEKENEERRKQSQESNKLLNKQLGFVPTIRSFFTTLLANTEVFLLRMLETSKNAEEFHQSGLSTLNTDGEPVKEKYFAWPEYRERNSSNEGSIEKYPGSNPNNLEWPEVKFVEEFYEALLLLRKKIESEGEEETFDFSQFENVPGRDDYFAINAMETPAGSSDPMTNYYGVNSVSDSGEGSSGLLEAIWDRFLITSNFSILNEPILTDSSIVYKMLDSENYSSRENIKTRLIPSLRVGSGGNDLVYDLQTFSENELGVLGRYESWNLVSSIRDDLFLLGFTTANASNFKDLIEETTVFSDKSRNLTLSPKSKNEFGGPKTLKPNIHEMKGEDLFKINDIIENVSLLKPQDFRINERDELPELDKKIGGSVTSKFLHNGYSFGLKDREKFNKLINSNNRFEWPEPTETTVQFSQPKDSYLLQQNKIDFNNNNDNALVQNIIRNFSHGGITTIAFGNDLGVNRGFLSKTSNFSQQNISTLLPRPILDIYPDYYFPYRSSRDFESIRGQVSTFGDFSYRYHEYGSVELTQSSNTSERWCLGTRFSGLMTFTPNADNRDLTQTWSYEKQYINTVTRKNQYIDIRPTPLNLPIKTRFPRRFTLDTQLYAPPSLHPNQYNKLYTREEVEDMLQEGEIKRKGAMRDFFRESVVNGFNFNLFSSGLRVLSSKNTVFTRFDWSQSEDDDENFVNISHLQSFPQTNTVNNGNLITESPFWRHNFPSILSESNQYPNNSDPHYFTYYEAQWAVVKNSPSNKSIKKEHINRLTEESLLSSNYSILEGFPMGVRVDLDNWENTSRIMKYTYAKNDADSNINWTPTNRRHILTNHNKQRTFGHNSNIPLSDNLSRGFDFKRVETERGNLKRIIWSLVGQGTIFEGVTNYNKTNVWKGTLAYLWLANHFHRPWTGMWGTSPSWHGPIETLAQSSIVAGIPKASLLLLGAVLWRMRESGLLISDDPKWNLPPKQNQTTVTSKGDEYLDPINFPVLSKKLIYTNPTQPSKVTDTFNTEFFGWENDGNEFLEEDISSSEKEYKNNKGVRPPTVSLYGSGIIYVQNIDNNPKIPDIVTCFPAPDEWPVLNLGMRLAKNIEDEGVENPFKNQYKIFQTWFDGRNALMLRFPNQGVKWLLRDDAFDRLEDDLKKAFEKLEDTLKKENFSDSATAKIFENTSKTIENETGEDGEVNDILSVIGGRTFEKVADDDRSIAGLDESYTKLTLLQHDLKYLRKSTPIFNNNENGRSAAGYLRGYLPIGPELWFLPTKVKEIIIGVFEDYVGDFNNYNGISDFDKILKEIDPLNFPYPEKYLKKSKPKDFPKAEEPFPGDITIQTTVSEAGEPQYQPQNLPIGNSVALETKPNEWILGLIGNPLLSLPVIEYDTDDHEIKSIIDTEWADETRGTDCINCVDVPKPLKKWRQNFGIAFGGATQISKPDVNDINKNTGNISNFIYNQIKTGDGESSENEGQNQQPSVLPELVLGELLNEYVVASTTPRTWWGDDGSTEEYYFDGRQWDRWISSLTENLEDNPDEIKDLISDGLKVVDEQQITDEDIKLDMYRSFKSIYDKWISSCTYGPENPKLFFNPVNKLDNGDRLLVDHFSFVNRTNQDIGDRVLINIEVVSQLFQNTENSLFGVTSDILDNSNFLFFPLPSYVDLTKGLTSSSNVSQKEKDLSRMFRPVADEETFINQLNRGPHYLCMFIGSTSKELNLSRYSDNCEDYITDINNNPKRFEGDSFNISNVESRPEEFNNNDNGGIVAFKVAFATDNQNHFIGVNLDQSEFKNTSEALKATELISQAGDPANSSGFITKSQSLYEVFLNRSYSCTVESMGNMMIQPLQYFELENVPMFVGTYLIRDISHKITPHNMKTTFKGDRIPQAEVPLIEDIIAQFDLAQVDVGASSDTDTTSTSSSGGGSSSGSRTGGSTNPSSNPVDLSKISDSTDIAAIRSYLENKDFFNEINEVRFPDPTYDYPKGENSNQNGGYAKRDPQKDPGQFHNYEQRVVGEKFEGIMLHWTGGWNNGVGSTIKTLLTRANPNKKGSVFRLHYHIIVDGDGVPHQIADLQKKVNHGGPLANATTLGLSYQGGVEKGDGETYTRTWEDWQNPSLNLSGREGENRTFNAKKQWESLVKSILYMKTVHPQLKYITSHEWVTAKADVGSGRNNKNQFPWDKLIEDLKSGGWNKNAAGGDPYIKNDWGVNRTQFSTNINKDYLLQSAISDETDEEEGG